MESLFSSLPPLPLPFFPCLPHPFLVHRNWSYGEDFVVLAHDHTVRSTSLFMVARGCISSISTDSTVHVSPSLQATTLVAERTRMSSAVECGRHWAPRRGLALVDHDFRFKRPFLVSASKGVGKKSALLAENGFSLVPVGPAFVSAFYAIVVPNIDRLAHTPSRDVSTHLLSTANLMSNWPTTDLTLNTKSFSTPVPLLSARPSQTSLSPNHLPIRCLPLTQLGSAHTHFVPRPLLAILHTASTLAHITFSCSLTFTSSYRNSLLHPILTHISLPSTPTSSQLSNPYQHNGTLAPPIHPLLAFHTPLILSTLGICKSSTH